MKQASGKRVLVVGGAGSLGRLVVDRFMRQGWQVSVYDRQASAHWPFSPIRVVPFEDGNSSALREAVALVDVVVNLAAYVPKQMNAVEEAPECVKCNVSSVIRLLDAVSATKANIRLVHISSAQVCQLGDVADENTPCYPIGHGVYYLGTKLLGEILVEGFSQHEDAHSIVLRPGSCYGPGIARSVVNTFVERALAGEPLVVQGGGMFGCDFTYVDDVVRTVVTAARHPATGVYNVTSGARTTIAELADVVVAALPEKNVAIDILPAQKPVFAGFPAYSCAKARRDLGYQPTPLATGIESLKAALRQG